MWEYLDNSWRCAPAPALVDSARVLHRAPVPAPAPTPVRPVCAPYSAAPTPRSIVARAPAIPPITNSVIEFPTYIKGSYSYII